MNHVRVRATPVRLSEPHSGPTIRRKWRLPCHTHPRSSPRDRRRLRAGRRDARFRPLANSGPRSAGDLLAATRKFLDGLEPDKRKAASFAWDGSEWRSWNYFGVGGFIKPGLRLEQMSAAQKEAAWDLLATLFSPAGIEKTRNVMTLQDVLAASGNGAGQRSSQRFSFAVYGTPAEAGAWGFRLEGHHLTQSIAVRDNRIVAVTPSSFSALPARITSGKHAGLMTLKDEEGWRGGSPPTSPRSRACASRTRRSTTSCPMRGASDRMPRRSVSRPPT